jgi:hypothetical protein
MRLLFLAFLMSGMIFTTQRSSAQISGPILEEKCTDFSKNLGSFRYHRFLGNSGSCWMSALPRAAERLVYRSYIVNSKGYFMVFNSIDADEYGVSDGARSFLLFPRNQIPTATDVGDTVYFKTGTKGVELILDTKTYRVLGMVGGIAKEDPKVFPGNRGGLEITQVNALVLDGGWMNYGDPFSVGSRESTFTDINGKTCKVRNREIFTYDSDGDTTVRFSDAELKKFLSRRCRNLTVHF